MSRKAERLRKTVDLWNRQRTSAFDGYLRKARRERMRRRVWLCVAILVTFVLGAALALLVFALGRR